MLDAWPECDAFREYIRPKPGEQAAPVTASVSASQRMRGRISLSISPAAMEEVGVACGDLFRVFSAKDEAGGVYISLVRDSAGCVALRSPPNRGASSAPKRGILRLAALGGDLIEPRDKEAVEWRQGARDGVATIDVYLPRQAKSPVVVHGKAPVKAKVPKPAKTAPGARAGAIYEPSQPPGERPADRVAINIARRLAGEGKADAVILRALEEDQNIKRDRAWLDVVLERV